MYYILRKSNRPGGCNRMWIEKDTGCRTVADCEKWLTKQTHLAGCSFLIVEDVIAFKTGITVHKVERTKRKTAAKKAA